MSDPYDIAQSSRLWGGVRQDIQNNAVDADTAALASSQAAAQDAENRRRRLASASPGLGVPVGLPQSPAAAGVGLSDVPMPAVGEGYDVTAEIAAAVSKAYGPDRPQYGPDEVGGYGHPLGIAQPARRHVTNLGDGRLLVDPGPDGRQPGGPYTLMSPPAAKPSMWSRLASRLRRR
jgi:hypothetical protein